MARRCELIGVGVQTGNNVSHSKRKTRRRFLPNIQNVSLRSDALGLNVPLRIAASTLRSVDKNGGLDSYLISIATVKLTDKAAKLKRQIKKKIAEKQVAA